MIARDFFPQFPRAAWEGWFAIFIAQAGSPLGWAKTHIFRSQCRYPLAALEGLRAPGEVVTLLGYADRVETVATAFSPFQLQTQQKEPFGLTLNTAVRWHVGNVASLSRQANDIRLDQQVALTERFDWVRWPRLLTYFGYQGPGELTLQRGGVPLQTHGLGIIEHAWGAAAPINPVSLVPGRWHWDVLFIATEAATPIACAAFLWLPLPRQPRGVRGFARFPGGEFSYARPLNLSYGVLERLDTGGKAPRTWRAQARVKSGIFNYEASASTPVAACTPGGGFFGFQFEGTLRLQQGPSQRLVGTGFCECGG